MTNDIHRDPDDAQGWRFMIQFGLVGLALLALGWVIPALFTGLFAGTGDAEAAGDAASRVQWVAIGLGLFSIVLGAFAGILYGPFVHLQRKYGTFGAIPMLAPGLLFAAAILALALR